MTKQEFGKTNAPHVIKQKIEQTRITVIIKAEIWPSKTDSKTETICNKLKFPNITTQWSLADQIFKGKTSIFQIAIPHNMISN